MVFEGITFQGIKDYDKYLFFVFGVAAGGEE